MVSTSKRVVPYSIKWVALLAVMLCVFVWIAFAHQYQLVTSVVSEGLREAMLTEADVFAALIKNHPDNSPLRGVSLPSNRRLTVIDLSGHVVYDSMGTANQMEDHNNRPEVIAARAHGSGFSQRHSASVDVDLLYVAKTMPDGRVVRVSTPLAIERSLKERLLQPMVFAALSAAVVAALAIMIHMWRERRRAQELMNVARAYANGEFSRRASLVGNDSMAHLGHELNAMGERLLENRQELAQQRSLLDGALAALSEGIACIDDMDRVIYANAAYRHLAASGSEIVNQPYYQHIPVLQPQKPHEWEHHRRQLLAMLLPIDDKMRVIVIHDLSERRHMESARRDFISAVSHEFKTPLTSISGFTETLLSGVIEEDATVTRDFVERIARHCARLEELVTDVLTISRLEQGAWDVQPTETDAALIAQRIVENHTELAARHRVSISRAGADSIPIVCDPELLTQLIGNLVSNAIRYNRPDGRVTVTITNSDADAVAIAVADTGIGIPKEHQERIFERFYRVDSHRSRASGGTGLGLSIIKQLLDALGGTITVESSPDGSVFTARLPKFDPRRDLSGKSTRTSD